MEKTQAPDPVEQYALDVVSGKELAGPMVRAACKRHLQDLEDSKDESRGIWWDLPAAMRVICFFRDVLRLSGSEHEGKPFILAPAQQFIVGSLFGWKTTADGSRRYRVAYVEMAKGCGKSPLAAGIGLYMLCADGAARAEVYSAAVDKDQAKILFRDAVTMVDQSPALARRITKSGGKGGDVTRVYNLAHLETGSFFRPVSSESSGRGKSGFRPYCFLFDEVHEHPTDAMVEFGRKNLKGRPNALALMITNSGVVDNTSVCMRYHEYAQRVVNGEKDDQFFGYVCGLDEGDRWDDPAVWKKAVPLLDVSVRRSYLEQEVRESIGMPGKQSLTRRLNFCEWVGSENPFVDPEVWRANGDAFDVNLLRGRECYGGLDLSKKNDLSALVLLFPMDDGRKAVLPFFWKPKASLREHSDRDRAPYQQWANQGFLIATPGEVIGYDYIALKLAEITSTYKVKTIAFDPYNIDQLKRECESVSGNIELVKHGQRAGGGDIRMGFSITAFEDHLKNRSLMHANHPVLEWCIGNAKVDQDSAENRWFDKRRQTGRIDGAVALAMACGMEASEVQSRPPEIFFIGRSR